MKKILLLMLILTACTDGYTDRKYPKELKGARYYDRAAESGQDVKVYEMTYDGCEYIYIYYYRGMGLAHKGNCKRCSKK